jgi:Ca2+-binding RTX toxin-like protein
MRRDNGALQDGTLGAMLLATVGLGLASTASPQDSNSIAALTTAVIAGTDGPDDLIGTLGDDTINGRGNADVMTGLAGNDTYIVDDEADEVVEQADEGTDTVRVFGTFLLPANVENLVLAGIQDGSGIGNSLDNRVIGNTGYNTLDGGPGNDTLTGRAGPDIFRFATTLSGTTNVDRVTDFNVVEDRIALHYPAFRAFVFSDGGLSPTKFHVGTSATTAAHRIVYNPNSGYLYYDLDGSGSIPAVRFARLSPNLPLTSGHFLIWSRYYI